MTCIINLRSSSLVTRLHWTLDKALYGGFYMPWFNVVRGFCLPAIKCAKTIFLCTETIFLCTKTVLFAWKQYFFARKLFLCTKTILFTRKQYSLRINNIRLRENNICLQENNPLCVKAIFLCAKTIFVCAQTIIVWAKTLQSSYKWRACTANTPSILPQKYSFNHSFNLKHGPVFNTRFKLRKTLQENNTLCVKAIFLCAETIFLCAKTILFARKQYSLHINNIRLPENNICLQENNTLCVKAIFLCAETIFVCAQTIIVWAKTLQSSYKWRACTANTSSILPQKYSFNHSFNLNHAPVFNTRFKLRNHS